MLKKRFIRHRARRGKKEPVALELNSLMDILTIMLVFLIMNYTISEVELSIPKDIKIPLSVSSSIVRKGVLLQVSKDFDIWAGDKFLMRVEGGNWQSTHRVQLANELYSIRDQIERMRMQTQDEHETTEGKSFSTVVNLVMDKEVNYGQLQNLMDIATDVGFEQFKFIVIEP